MRCVLSLGLAGDETEPIKSFPLLPSAQFQSLACPLKGFGHQQTGPNRHAFLQTPIAQAGWAAATKFVNQSPAAKCTAVASLARIEKMDFIKPMRIGEVSILEAEVGNEADCVTEGAEHEALTRP